MSFGDIIQSTGSPNGESDGIGGDSSTIWHCNYNNNKVHELSTSDLSVIRQGSSPASGAFGIGGNNEVIWNCNAFNRKLYELSTSDFSAIRSGTCWADTPWGIGGDKTTIWCVSESWAVLMECSTSDFSMIRYTGRYGRGCGGSSRNIWLCNTTTIYDLNTSDFSTLRSVAAPRTGGRGCGGKKTSLYFVNSSPDIVYELDPEYTNVIQVGDNVLLIPNYGDTYDRAAIKGSDINTGDDVQLYPLKGGAKVAIKEEWSSGDNIIF